MEESEVDTYKLNTEDTNQTLRISLINNEQISMILDNITNNQRYTTLVNLENLRKVCQVFSSTKNIQEALQILKNIIESGNIILTDDPQENKMEIRYNLVLENEEELPFDIELALEKQNNEEEEAEVLPPEFDYQGNKEAESKYGNTTSNTTEFVKPIVQSNVKPPILQLEYIEPILQVHYPDGTTKSTALPPRIQGANGETPNITEEQFKSIREQMNNGGAIRNFSPLRDFLNNNRSNSVVGKKNISMYSTQSTPYPAVNNISTVNPFQNSVRTSFDQDESKYNYQTTINNNPNRYNNDFNKTASGYSVMTMQARNYGNNDNFNNTNIYQKSNLNQHQNTNFNNVVERRPRMINNSQKHDHPRDNIRSLSVPSHKDDYKFNSSQKQNIYQQPNSTSNPFQSNYQNQTTNVNHKEKYPYDRDTKRTKNKVPQNRDPKNSLSHIQRQQQRLLEVQKKLAEIQQQQKQLQARQRELILQNQHLPSQNRLINQNKNPKMIPKQPVRQNQQSMIRKAQSQSINFNQQNNKLQSQQQMKQSQEEMQQIRQTNSLVNNQKFIQNQNSGEIKQSKTHMTNSQNSRYKKQSSTPITSQAPSLGNKDISQQLISLAQMASMQNEANPNFKQLQAITLQQQSQTQSQEQEEVQEYQQQEEIVQQQEEIVQQQQYVNAENENVEEQQQGDDQNLNIEALFFTEEGRVIFRNGLLRGIIHKYAEIDEVVSRIQDRLLKGVKFNLVYKAFDDGDKARIFHEKCDKYKMSLVLIETDKDIRFGGFTMKSWEGHCLKKIDNNAFVFSLETGQIYDIIQNEPAIGCYPKFGPVFFGCQIRIYDDFFSKGGTTCHKGLNYKTIHDFELNNGEQKYLIKDIEVYSIETIDI